ncbi:Isoleucyl-tRNA synthetase [Umbelopsis sp. PMI_123]|nr:Isoleucyl-tRNA synthetase [Umbelopsis sp. PMI_123]
MNGILASARTPLRKRVQFLTSNRNMCQSAVLRAGNPVKKQSKNLYESTVLLPNTPFPLRADAAKREHLFHDRCTKDLYHWQLRNNPKELFVLHDGPPYANGDVHMGHALNKILKDIIIRYKVLLGHKVHYTPGWDCHGLPIELKALEKLKANDSKKLLPSEIRKVARERALLEVEKQKKDFMSWGVLGDWDKPYLTLNKDFEIRQLQVFNEMVKKGYIYRQLKPVYWSPSSKTALAESELEYNDEHLSRSVYVRFPITKPVQALKSLQKDPNSPVYALIWSTTPWTLPANRAIAVNNDLVYTVLDVKGKTSSNSTYIIAESLVDALVETLEASGYQEIGKITGSQLVGAEYRNVLNGENMPIIAASHVTDDSGTGLVHTAPGHGMEDYEACRSLGIMPFSPVDGDGYFTAEAGKQFEGLFAFDQGNETVINTLQEQGFLVKEQPYKHKYPYDWRTKKPVMLRATAQWFANVENLQKEAVDALRTVNMVPSVSHRRLEGFTMSRKEWCISRQRAWGVPIPVLYDVETDEPLLTEANIAHVLKVIDEKGIDSWWSEEDDMMFVAPEYQGSGKKYKRGYDTMDVWFDSGTSWTLIDGLEGRDPTKPVADVYLEGSDQHRGWFQSSLLTSIAVKSKSPYSTLVTHGFLLDEKGYKMSKSLGNTIVPSLVTKGGKDRKKNPAYGTDILRLWVANTEFTKDVSVGPTVIAQVSDMMRKVRTTSRFMLGNLSDFSYNDAVPYDQLKPVDQYMLYELGNFTNTMTQAYDAFDFNGAMQALQHFTANTLSSFYFDIIKDRLYNDPQNSLSRRTAQTVLAAVLNTYTLTLAPVVVHTAEEIYEQYKGQTEQPQSSVFKVGWPVANAQWENLTVKEEWDTLRALKGEVNRVLEDARQDKNIRSSQEASVDIFLSDASAQISQVVQKHASELASLFITASVNVHTSKESMPSGGYERECTLLDKDNVIISSRRSNLHKCPRCRNYFSTSEEDLCSRCATTIDI